MLQPGEGCEVIMLMDTWAVIILHSQPAHALKQVLSPRDRE